MCKLHYFLGNYNIQSYNNTAYILADSLKMIFLTVSHDDHIILFNIALHHLRIGCSNENFSLNKISVAVSLYNLASYSLSNPLILCPRIGKEVAICCIHIGLGNISDGHKTFQATIFIADRKRYDAVLLHHIPGILQRHALICRWADTDIHIFNLGSYISEISRRLYAKTVQHILGLLIHMTCTARNILFSGDLGF